MQIKNKRTSVIRYVTQEEWAVIVQHPQLKNKFTVIDRSDIVDSLKQTKGNVIIPQEIINFKNLQKIKKEQEVKPDEDKPKITKTKKPKEKKDE